MNERMSGIKKEEEKRRENEHLSWAQKKINHVLFNVKNKENEQKRITAIGSM